jgi:hypothetical protein
VIGVRDERHAISFSAVGLLAASTASRHIGSITKSEALRKLRADAAALKNEEERRELRRLNQRLEQTVCREGAGPRH